MEVKIEKRENITKTIHKMNAQKYMYNFDAVWIKKNIKAYSKRVIIQLKYFKIKFKFGSVRGSI